MVTIAGYHVPVLGLCESEFPKGDKAYSVFLVNFWVSTFLSPGLPIQIWLLYYPCSHLISCCLGKSIFEEKLYGIGLNSYCYSGVIMDRMPYPDLYIM